MNYGRLEKRRGGLTQNEWRARTWEAAYARRYASGLHAHPPEPYEARVAAASAYATSHARWRTPPVGLMSPWAGQRHLVMLLLTLGLWTPVVLLHTLIGLFRFVIIRP